MPLARRLSRLVALIALVPALLAAGVWGGFALHFHAGQVWVAGWVVLLACALGVAFRRGPMAGWVVAAFALAGLLGWWSSIRPSQDRAWNPDVARTLTGRIDGSTVTLENVRNFDWRGMEDFSERWETRTYDLDQITSVDMILNYWMGPAIAHTLVSFGFEDGEHLVFSVEIRKEQGEAYSPYAGFFRTYELSIIAADERDALRFRTNVRRQELHLYRVSMPQAVMQDLFRAYVASANALAVAPRWYNTITANCTTIVFAMIDRIVPGLPLDRRLVLSGYLPEYVYELGALDMRYDLETLREMGAITPRGQAADREPGYSIAIRAGLPPP